MTALSIALVVVAALAWDAYRRTLALRRVDELEELRAALRDQSERMRGYARGAEVEAARAETQQLGEELKRLRKDIELSGRSRR